MKRLTGVWRFFKTQRPQKLRLDHFWIQTVIMWQWVWTSLSANRMHAKAWAGWWRRGTSSLGLPIVVNHRGRSLEPWRPLSQDVDAHIVRESLGSVATRSICHSPLSAPSALHTWRLSTCSSKSQLLHGRAVKQDALDKIWGDNSFLLW